MVYTVHSEWKGRLIFPLFRRRARAALSTLIEPVETYCISVTPIDTGALRSTITAFVPNSGVSFVLEAGGPAPAFGGSYIVYAGFVHDGTNRMAARPFITWTMTAFHQRLQKTAAAAWRPF